MLEELGGWNQLVTALALKFDCGIHNLFQSFKKLKVLILNLKDFFGLNLDIVSDRPRVLIEV